MIMGRLSVVEEPPQGGNERQHKIANILSGSDQVIQIGRYFWSDDDQAGKNEYFSTSWRTDIDPSTGLSLVRRAYKELDNKYRADENAMDYEGPEPDAGLLLIPDGELGIESFLDGSQFAPLLTPDKKVVRIEGPFADFLFDVQDWSGEGRRVGVISHLNISQVIAKLATQTATGLGASYESELTEKYDQVLGRYQTPERK